MEDAGSIRMAHHGNGEWSPSIVIGDLLISLDKSNTMYMPESYRCGERKNGKHLTQANGERYSVLTGFDECHHHYGIDHEHYCSGA